MAAKTYKLSGTKAGAKGAGKTTSLSPGITKSGFISGRSNG
jgi:hypothetical protein